MCRHHSILDCHRWVVVLPLPSESWAYLSRIRSLSGSLFDALLLMCFIFCGVLGPMGTYYGYLAILGMCFISLWRSLKIARPMKVTGHNWILSSESHSWPLYKFISDSSVNVIPMSTSTILRSSSYVPTSTKSLRLVHTSWSAYGDDP